MESLQRKENQQVPIAIEKFTKQTRLVFKAKKAFLAKQSHNNNSTTSLNPAHQPVSEAVLFWLYADRWVLNLTVVSQTNTL